ncbi:MAG: TIGR00730 family Rossman fold protein [Acidobacteria bacterium]|nr:TIGR00730 family Rossman fold protein [Acidobacteriota bacterium]
MSELKLSLQLGVFCGSSIGAKPLYRDVAVELGRAIALRQVWLVYGGGGIGLMGALADAVLAAGGQVIGVIPQALASKELAHPNLTELRIVRTMHERKAVMAELADAFLALPGGLGTFDELFEILTWAQLGIHRKPVGLLNTDHYFDPLVGMVEHAVREGFVSPLHRELIIVASSVDDWFDRLATFVPPPISTRWIDLQEV